ncbi:hypothetical protein GCM10022260_26790 [Gaetbulibacter aestuarii]
MAYISVIYSFYSILIKPTQFFYFKGKNRQKSKLTSIVNKTVEKLISNRCFLMRKTIVFAIFAHHHKRTI